MNDKTTAKRKCYNCKFAEKGFKIGKVTHHYCGHPKYSKESFESGELHPFDALNTFSYSCKDHKLKDEL